MELNIGIRAKNGTVVAQITTEFEGGPVTSEVEIPIEMVNGDPDQSAAAASILVMKACSEWRRKILPIVADGLLLAYAKALLPAGEGTSDGVPDAAGGVPSTTPPEA